ncbi:MAG: porin family protein [Bacteriovoracaceae bacterium]|jgi:hypothetical protein|nr:porin family protein [Bacteriovoracaceae bacterium]
MKNLIIITILTFFITNAHSAELKVEPLYSFEKTYRIEPAPAKFVTRTYIGARGTYGVPLLSAELEVARSEDSDTFPAQVKKVDYETYRAMLGLKSYPFTFSYGGVYFRAGARAKKESVTTTISGVETKNEGEIVLDPYAGAGITIAFSNMFALNAGVTLVYNRDAPSNEQFDRQTTFSFTIKASNR